MLIKPAFAQAGGAGDTNSMLMSLLPFALIFVIMYFLILRPQQKKVKDHAELVKNIRRGDTVVGRGVGRHRDDGQSLVDERADVALEVLRRAADRDDGRPGASRHGGHRGADAAAARARYDDDAAVKAGKVCHRLLPNCGWSGQLIAVC